MKGAALFFISLMLVGCAHVVSKELREKVDKEVKAEALFLDPDAYKGKTVMLGGVIINSVNAEEGTYIEALERPLTQQGRPEYSDVSRGRYIVFADKYIDTAVYSKGRLITVVGEVAGKEVRPLGEIRYSYVVLKAIELYLHLPYPEPPIRFGFGVFHTF